MQLVNSEDNSVCHEALQALQKLMIYNWYVEMASDISFDKSDKSQVSAAASC
jgi:hypothetical protein